MFLTTQELLIRLKDTLFDLLGDQNDGIGALGEFEFLVNGTVVSTTPSIQIGFPLETENQPIIRMKENSGIKCTVHNDVIMYDKKIGNRSLLITYKFPVTLDQYNPKGNLTEAMKAIMRMPRFFRYDPPSITPARILEDKGRLPARALFYFCYFENERMYY